jgi:hypothetical protein
VVGAAILWALVLAHKAINVIRNCVDVFSMTRTKLTIPLARSCKIRQDACTSIHRLIKWSRGNMSGLMRRKLSGFWEKMAFTCRASMLVTMLGTSYDIEIVTGVVLRSCSNIA